MAALYNTRRWYIRQYVLADASVRTRARTSRQVCVHVQHRYTKSGYMCVYIHVYVYIDTTERGVLFTARGRYCRQERLSGITRSRARVREMDGRKRPRTTKGDDTLCSTLFSVYFSTSISPIRYRFFVNTVLRVGSIIVWHPQLSLSLSLSMSLLLSSSSSHLYRPWYTCTSFLTPSPFPVVVIANPLPPSFSRPFFSSFSFHSLFCISLLISLDRIDLFTCALAITISSLGLSFLSGRSYAAWKWIDLL